MPKTSGYMRSYRAQRQANRGRPLGRALRAGEADEVRAMVASGMSPSAARKQVTWANDYMRDMQAISNWDFTRLKPTGKAPRGMGDEWKARRQLDSLLKRAARSGYGTANYRGQKGRNRWQWTHQQNRNGELHRFRQAAMRDIAQGPGSFRQKYTRLKEQYEVASWASSPYN